VIDEVIRSLKNGNEATVHLLRSGAAHAVGEGLSGEAGRIVGPCRDWRSYKTLRQPQVSRRSVTEDAAPWKLGDLRVRQAVARSASS